MNITHPSVLTTCLFFNYQFVNINKNIFYIKQSAFIFTTCLKKIMYRKFNLIYILLNLPVFRLH